MGRMHAVVYGSLERAQVVAVVDRISERAEEFAREFGCRGFGTLEAALGAEDVDVVDICLPTYLHREFAEGAAAAGKHVFCEKPMALTVADAEAMVEACERSGSRLMIGHCIRFWPEYALLKKLVDEETMGSLLSVNLTRYGEFPTWSSENWLADEAKAGGGALDMHIHDTDYALYLLGSPLAMTSAGTDDGRGIGQIFTTMKFPGGAIAHLEGGWNLPPGTPFKMAFRAIFERGAAIMDAGPMTIYEKGKPPYVPEFPKMEASGGGNISDLGGYYHELAEFVDCVLDERPFTVSTPESSLESLRVVLEEIGQAKTPPPTPSSSFPR
jgi:predicted dehydrogenase